MKPDWFTTTVEAICLGILEDSAWDRLPVLADAMEDAGYPQGWLLGHFRGDRAAMVTGAYSRLVLTAWVEDFGRPAEAERAEVERNLVRWFGTPGG